MNKRIYISIPITGENYEDQKNHAFFIATNLAQEGWEPVTPFDLIKNPMTPYNEAMGACIKELLTCDALYMCRGWEKSKGCNAELQVAIIYGLKVMME